MSTSSPGISRVAGVIIWTEQFEELLCFYRDVLELPLRGAKPGFANFEWGGFRLSVAAHDDVQGQSRDPLRVMVNFAVDDIFAAHRRLTESGVAFSRCPEQERWGGWVATLADPDGNTLQLLQLPR